MRKLNPKSRLLLLGLIIVVLFSALIMNSDFVSAEKNDQVVTKQETTASDIPAYSPTIFPSIAKIIGALALVIASIYGGLFLLKKMMGRKYSGNGKGNNLEVLETTYLGPKKTVSLIRVADKAVLVGSTESQISILTELSESSTEQIMESLSAPQQEEAFTTFLKTASQKVKDLTVRKVSREAVNTRA